MALSGTIYTTVHTGYRLQIEWTATQDIANNQSTITSKLYWMSINSSYTINASASHTGYNYIGGTSYSFSATAGLTSLQKKQLASSTRTITHASDGTLTTTLSATFPIAVTLSGTYYDTASIGATSITLNTIPRASSISAFSSFTIGNSIPITISRASTSFTHDLTLKVGSTTVATRTGIATDGTMTLSSDEQNIVYAAIPSSTAVTVTLYCTTKNGTTTIGSTVSKNATATVDSSIVPTFTSITASGVNAAVGAFIKNVTPITFTINGAIGAKYSTISSYSVKFNGVNYSGSTVTTGIINAYGPITATATIIDSRGIPASKTVDVNLLDYATPSITGFTVNRCNSDGSVNVMGTYAKIIRTGNVSSLNSLNYFTYKIYSKLRTTTDWGTVKATASSAAGSIAMNSSNILSDYSATSSYDFKLELIDILGKSTSATVILSTGQVTMSLGQTGVGVGKVWEQGALDASGDIYENGAKLSSKYLSLTGGTLTGGLLVNTIAVSSSIADLINNAPWYGIGKSNLLLSGETGSQFSTQVGGYWGVNIKTGSHELRVPRTDSDLLYDGYKVWHAGNDGDGSGLDADYLGGVHSSYHISAGTNNTGTTGSVADLNAIWKSGFYDGTASSNNPAGAGQWAWILNMAHGGDHDNVARYGTQIVGENNSGVTGRLWFRNRTSDGSGSWKEIAESGMLRGGVCALNASSWVSVSFAITFRSAPRVVLTSYSDVSGSENGKVRNITTTGFEAVIGGSGSNASYNYIALGNFG